MKLKRDDKNVHWNESAYGNLILQGEAERAFTMMYIVPSSLYAWSICNPLISLGNFFEYIVNLAGCWFLLFFAYAICTAVASTVLTCVAKKYDVGKLYLFVRRILYFVLTLGVTYFLVEKCGIRITVQ